MKRYSYILHMQVRTRRQLPLLDTDAKSTVYHLTSMDHLMHACNMGVFLFRRKE